MDLDTFIRPIPDFPKPGILFRDITPLLADAAALTQAIDRLVEPWRSERLAAIAAVEARGARPDAHAAAAVGGRARADVAGGATVARIRLQVGAEHADAREARTALADAADAVLGARAVVARHAAQGGLRAGGHIHRVPEAVGLE